MSFELHNIAIELLSFDMQNPRLVEFGLSKTLPEQETIKILWKEMAVEEIVLSIAANGFFINEPLIAVPNAEKSGHFIVIEGNRRLAAIKLILNPSILKGRMIDLVERIDPNIINSLATIPVYVVREREEAWRYIGFKHVNGPAKWGSFAKAQYIAQIHNSFNIPLTDIALQIGDTNKTVQKLYQGLMVIQQAENMEVFDRTDIAGTRLFFSHLYTGIQYEGIRNYIGLSDVETESATPAAPEKKEELGQLLLWLFGSRKSAIQPIIISQNPDLRHLDEIVKNRQAVIALKSNYNLNAAWEMSRSDSVIFDESLIEAKLKLQKALSLYTSGYFGDEDMLKIANTNSELANTILIGMKAINSRSKD